MSFKIGEKEYSPIKLGAIGLTVAAGAAAMIGYGETIATVIPSVAWKTQAGHEHDVARLESLTFDETARLEQMFIEFLHEIECGDYREELDLLLLSGNITAFDNDRIRVIRQKMGPESDGGLNCVRFEE